MDNLPEDETVAEPLPEPPVTVRSYPGIAQSIGLCVIFYCLVLFAMIPLELFEHFGKLPLGRSTSLLISQLVAWPLTIWVTLLGAGCSFREACPLTRFPLRIVPPLLVASVGAWILLIEVAIHIPMPESLRKYFEAQSTDRGSAVFFISVVILAPLAEELFFRGQVLRGFLGRYSVTKSIWASAVMFALVHLNPWQALVALPVGLACAWMAIRTGSLIPGILCHAMVNLTPTCLIEPLLRALNYDDEKLKLASHTPPAILAIGVAMAAIGGFILWRQVDCLPAPQSPGQTINAEA